MIYLIPFFNAFILFICLERDQLLYKSYKLIQENIFVRLHPLIIKILGGCVLCTATWMGIVEIGVCNLIKQIIYPVDKYILTLSYNAVSTTILYTLMK